MDDLVTWLREQLDRRERIALAAGGREATGRWHAAEGMRAGMVEDAAGNIVVYDEGSPTEDQAAYIAENDPAATLAEVERDRLILQTIAVLRTPVPTPEGYPAAARQLKMEVELAEEQAAEVFAKLLALPHAGRPGYREEWKP